MLAYFIILLFLYKKKVCTCYLVILSNNITDLLFLKKTRTKIEKEMKRIFDKNLDVIYTTLKVD